MGVKGGVGMVAVSRQGSNDLRYVVVVKPKDLDEIFPMEIDDIRKLMMRYPIDEDYLKSCIYEYYFMIQEEVFKNV